MFCVSQSGGCGPKEKPRSMVVLLYTLFLWVGLKPDQTLSEPTCQVWSQPEEEPVSVLDGEVGWLSCPLFTHPSIFNSSHYDLSWSRLSDDGVQEQPITFSRSLITDQHRLMMLPATSTDTGEYRCTIRNRSTCVQATVRLTVLQPDDVVRSVACEPAVAAGTSQVPVHLQEGGILDCPDLQEASGMSGGPPNVTWLYVKPGSYCASLPLQLDSMLQVTGQSVEIHIMTTLNEGFYYCTVRYQRAGHALSFTRRINVTAVSQTSGPKEPAILHLSLHPAFPVRTRSSVHLVCTALFPYLDSERKRKMWWTVDGTRLDQLPDRRRFSSTDRLIREQSGDRTEESVLVIQDFQAEDLKREFNCSVENEKGRDTRRAELHPEVSLPSLELGFGLGAALVLMLLLFIVYHMFWLELLLLYRSWFGTKERDSDNKDYDVYISYARNSEDEYFVLSTLRCVLENHFGYSVCIFDRDSLPGGTINDDTLTFVARSRRLLVVVGPGYGCWGSQALLELKAGIDNMALGGHLRVILVQYRPVQRQGWVKELRRARVALTLVRWQGEKSKELTSRFWKQLRVELPVSTVRTREKAVATSPTSQTGLIGHTLR